MAYQKFCEQNLISDRKCLGSLEEVHKTPKQSAMSNRNLFLVLTYKALNYNCDTWDSPNKTFMKAYQILVPQFCQIWISIIELNLQSQTVKEKISKVHISFQIIENE